MSEPIVEPIIKPIPTNSISNNRLSVWSYLLNLCGNKSHAQIQMEEPLIEPTDNSTIFEPIESVIENNAIKIDEIVNETEIKLEDKDIIEEKKELIPEDGQCISTPSTVTSDKCDNCSEDCGIQEKCECKITEDQKEEKEVLETADQNEETNIDHNVEETAEEKI